MTQESPSSFVMITPMGGLRGRPELADGESQVRGQVVAWVQPLREGAESQGHADTGTSDSWLKFCLSTSPSLVSCCSLLCELPSS